MSLFKYKNIEKKSNIDYVPITQESMGILEIKTKCSSS